jgi:hypothetical protein
MAKKQKLTDADILAIITNELSNANITTNNPEALRKPLQYYLGLPDGTETEGRSTLTSTDVADAIEWIMPQIMKSFTQNNEVVVFDPVHPGDELQADIESEYVYDVLMKQNNGFVLIHQFVKDALMQRNGILKVYYEKNDETKTYNYSGLTEQQLQMVAADPKVKVSGLTPNQFIDEQGQLQTTFDAKIVVTTGNGKVCIDPVAPEEFRNNSQHNSIDLSEARFTAHIVNKTISDLREEGISEEDLDHLYASDLIRTSYRFSYQNEQTIIPSTSEVNDPNRLVEVCECFLKLDVNGDGIAERKKVLVAGATSPTRVLTIEDIDSNPWVSTTAILMSHKFQGLSIFDRLKQVQDNKTAIIRNIMDNMYLQNNQRNVVVEGQVNLDDLMVSRPGGIIRAKRADAIMPLATPQIGDAAFTMMRYLDEVKAGRVGVSQDGNASPENIGDRVGSQGVERMMTAKEELVGLIIRVICETGIKPLCNKIRDLVTQHTDSIEDFQYRGQWIKVNPSEWPNRTKSTVRVGTGTGDVRAKLAAIGKVMEVQAQIIAQPGQSLTNQAKAYSALDDFCKFSGLNGASKYFIDPNSQEGQQASQAAGHKSQQEQQQQQQAQLETLRMQAELAKAATTTAESERANVILKGQVELVKHERDTEKHTFQARIADLLAEIERGKLVEKGHKEIAELQFKYDQLSMQTGVALTKIEADSKSDQDANFQRNEEIADEDQSEVGNGY